MEWIPRTVVDEDVEFPYRYNLKNINTGEVLNTYNIKRAPGNVEQESTQINRAYLQPIEDFLKAVNDDLKGLGLEISRIDTKLTQSESALNSRISATETTLTAQITNTQISLSGRISTTESNLNGQITNANTRIDTANGQITNIDERIKAINLEGYAPLAYPVLEGGRGDLPSKYDSSTRLATTEWVYNYVDALLGSI